MWAILIGIGIPIFMYSILSVAITISRRLGIIVAIIMGILVIFVIMTLIRFNQILDNIFSLGGLLSL